MSKLLILFLIQMMVLPSFCVWSQRTPQALNILPIDKTNKTVILDDTINYIIKIESDHCKWCHVMNRLVYQDTAIVDILNKNVRVLNLNLKERSSINFDDKTYEFHSDIQMHGLAIYLSDKSLNLPVTIFINKSKDIHKVYNGYILPEDFKIYLKAFIDEPCK